MIKFAPLNINPVTMDENFNLPGIGELRKLTEAQLKPIFFALEQHRAKQLLAASEEYTDRIDRINKNYTNDFQTLADILAELRSKSA